MENEDNELLTISSEIMSEEPKILSALKNLSAVVASKYFLPQMDPNHISHDELSPEIVLSVIRLVCKSLQELSLPEPISWGCTYAQEAEQSASERLDQLLRYKALYLLWTKVKSSDGGKVYQLFGRCFFTYSQCWGDLVTICRQKYEELQVDRRPSVEALEHTLDLFAESMKSEQSDLHRLVWSENFYEELKSRRLAREDRRVERFAEEDEEKVEDLTRTDECDEKADEPLSSQVS